MDSVSARLDAAFGSCFNSGPVAESTIANAESELGLRFPPSYRVYLAKFGASLGPGYEIYGLPPLTDPNRPPQWNDVVRSTLALRPNSLPINSVAISHDGMELGYFLVCSQADHAFEGPVMEWGPMHNGGKIVADTFMSFIEKHMGG
jgi:hypothetical protein